MEHLPIVLDLAKNSDEIPLGHALMASCPPIADREPGHEVPFRAPAKDDNDHFDRPSWQTAKGDLSVLLDLSERLDLDGEITPVMAWGMVLAHPNFASITPSDIKKLAEELGRKVRCYG